MKRFLTAACAALAACLGLARPGLAGSFGVFYAGRHCNDCGVCFKQYNAFTPLICGDVSGHCGGSPGGCGFGGCGGCGFGGPGFGGPGGCDPGYRMQGRLAPIGAPCAGAYCGALGYCPGDGYGLGAFGTNCCGKLRVQGQPTTGGCASCGKGWSFDNIYGSSCGPNGCGGFDGGYAGFPGYGGYPADGGYPAGDFAPGGVIPDATPIPAGQPEAIPAPKSPSLPAPTPKATTTSKLLATTTPGSAAPRPLPAQPVSYQAGYGAPVAPLGYGVPAWGYPAGYWGYGAPMAYPGWGYPMMGYPGGW